MGVVLGAPKVGREACCGMRENSTSSWMAVVRPWSTALHSNDSGLNHEKMVRGSHQIIPMHIYQTRSRVSQVQSISPTHITTLSPYPRRAALIQPQPLKLGPPLIPILPHPPLNPIRHLAHQFLIALVYKEQPAVRAHFINILHEDAHPQWVALAGGVFGGQGAEHAIFLWFAISGGALFRRAAFQLRRRRRPSR